MCVQLYAYTIYNENLKISQEHLLKRSYFVFLTLRVVFDCIKFVIPFVTLEIIVIYNNILVTHFSLINTVFIIKADNF